MLKLMEGFRSDVVSRLDTFEKKQDTFAAETSAQFDVLNNKFDGLSRDVGVVKMDVKRLTRDLSGVRELATRSAVVVRQSWCQADCVFVRTTASSQSSPLQPLLEPEVEQPECAQQLAVYLQQQEELQPAFVMAAAVAMGKLRQRVELDGLSTQLVGAALPGVDAPDSRAQPHITRLEVLEVKRSEQGVLLLMSLLLVVVPLAIMRRLGFKRFAKELDLLLDDTQGN
jgi:hypothetical protein